MFEKEAEKWTIDYVCKDCSRYKECRSKEQCTCKECSKEKWQKGAEFGYNKAFVEADKNLKAIVTDFNKANEWHEIASKRTPKGEISKKYMPKNKEKVLLKYHFSGDDEIHISDGYYDAYDLEFHIANNPKYRIVCVIAWKEIVLPALPKEIKK